MSRYDCNVCLCADSINQTAAGCSCDCHLETAGCPCACHYDDETLSSSAPSGVKYDEGKLRYDLIPATPFEELAFVYTMGATKYSDRNWEKGIAWTRIYAAMMRHLQAWWAGEARADDDKQHHLASLVWGAFALMEYERTHPEMDDRPWMEN